MDSTRNRLLVHVTALASPGDRGATRRALAAATGAEDLLIFVFDEEVGMLLPAPGFPQTLPRAEKWRPFLDLCYEAGSQRTELPLGEGYAKVLGMRGDDGSVAVLVGGFPGEMEVECLRILLPLLAAVFRGERNATVAGSNAQMARSAAAQAQLLAASVDQARSALRQALIGAEAASRAKDEFLASLSHELRTPLTPVLIATAALLEDEKLPEEFHGALEMMQRNIELEVRLIDDLLDLTRIVNGKLTLQKKDCDLHALLDHSLEIVRPEIIAKKLAVEVRKNAQNAWVWADAVRMHQVLWNLLRNAAKFTPEGGRIILESANEGDHVSVSVSDTGMGISPESLEQIFRPFEQGKATGDHRFGGMGLGLAISKAVVDQHSGLLRASSAGAGLGACFTIQLQTVTPPDPTTERRQPPDETLNQTMHVLLVEDHLPTLDALKALLQRSGCEVTTASSVKLALECARSGRFNGVLSDVGLPDGSGLELMRQLRDEHGLTGIALSGYGMEEDVLRSKESGFVAHLTKPVRAADLRQAILLHFGKSPTNAHKPD